MGRGESNGGARLRALVDMIPEGSRVADIGTDHALLPRILLEERRAAHCIATEITPAALDRLQDRIGRFPLPATLELRAGDGLAPLLPSDRLDVLVLAGMGAGTQVAILSSPLRTGLGSCRLVLQPQGEPAVLRRWLAGNHYRIIAERLQEIRGFFHLTLAAIPHQRESPADHPVLFSEDLMAAGPLLVRSGDPVVRRFWEIQLHRLRRLEAAGARGAGGKQAAEDRQQAKRVLEALPTDAL
ncbi:MAG: SAM-dependent methyltransferase [Acidobacteria bacterium]|uniref:SAM-dependent methyltransferase n=1 Tax=Candidatus Polarisedimenticola svalbardensis TaxID=2886004 RepID=A0A8J6XZK5_9BACT|nr:SAM-dependent methyltransferase [Candidatus Polarisedimenticola svalbardensis]